jgi:hypothetical protein
MTGLWPEGVVIRLVSPVFYYYITSNDYVLLLLIKIPPYENRGIDTRQQSCS